MRLDAFRVWDFRSIIDTGWVKLSSDNVTCLVGQNEAGKTAVLEALYCFTSGSVVENDLRTDGSIPKVTCRFVGSRSEFGQIYEEMEVPNEVLLPRGVKGLLLSQKHRMSLVRTWDSKGSPEIRLGDAELRAIFEGASSSGGEPEEADEDVSTVDGTGDAPSEEEHLEADDKEPPHVYTEREFAEHIFKYWVPKYLFFRDDASLLPNEIDVEHILSGGSSKRVDGFQGVKSFLALANLDLNLLEESNPRVITNQLDRINNLVTEEFQRFWSQVVGKNSKIRIECELKNRGPDSESPGMAYLAFWIKDGQEKLYPEQRSRGVRWFLSFYLQLQSAATRRSQVNPVYLIDEPGGSLHAKAQEDVLRVFEAIKDRTQIIYTTHSPFLVNIDAIHRILAIQRDDYEDERSETKVYDSHTLSAAHSETLSPVYTAMGTDFSSQRAIKKKGNIILEELSAFYYFRAFWQLLERKEAAHFIGAQGVNNVPKITSMFLGWGLSFSVVVDDDTSGRRVYMQLKRDLCGDDDAQAADTMYKLKGCGGIEDLFSKSDFVKHVLNGNTRDYKVPNSKHMRRRPKAVIARDFMIKVDKEQLVWNELDADSRQRISDAVERVCLLLKNH